MAVLLKKEREKVSHVFFRNICSSLSLQNNGQQEWKGRGRHTKIDIKIRKKMLRNGWLLFLLISCWAWGNPPPVPAGKLYNNSNYSSLNLGGLRPLVHVSNESSLTTVVRQISNQSVTSTGTKEASNWLVSRWIEGDSKTFKVGRVSLQQLEWSLSF